MNVMGAMIPCHRPRQKPATMPCTSGVFTSAFAPGAHEASRRQHSARQSSAAAFFMSILRERYITVAGPGPPAARERSEAVGPAPVAAPLYLADAGGRTPRR